MSDHGVRNTKENSAPRLPDCRTKTKDEPQIHKRKKAKPPPRPPQPYRAQITIPVTRLEVVPYRGPQTRDEKPSIIEDVETLCCLMIIWPLMLSVIFVGTCVESCVAEPKPRQDQ